MKPQPKHNRLQHAERSLEAFIASDGDPDATGMLFGFLRRTLESYGEPGLAYPVCRSGPVDDAFARRALPYIVDILGNQTRPRLDHVSILMDYIPCDSLWRASIATGHDAHALLRLAMLVVNDGRNGSTAHHRRGQVMQWLGGWLLDGLAFDTTATPAAQRTILDAAFGPWWCDFHGASAGKTIDYYLLVQDRPCFLPGLVTRTAQAESMHLPEMDP